MQNIEVLKGQIINEIEGMSDFTNLIRLVLNSGEEYRIFTDRSAMNVFGDPVDILGEELLSVSWAEDEDVQDFSALFMQSKLGTVLITSTFEVIEVEVIKVEGSE